VRRFAQLIAPHAVWSISASLFLLAWLALALLAAPSALAAGTTTGIVRAHAGLDVFTWTPTQTGFLAITIGWTDPVGDPVGGFPEAAVHVCVQGSDGIEPYADMEVAALRSGANPSTATLTVYSYNVGSPYFFSVSPSVAETRYHLTVDFRRTLISSFTRVVDATGYTHPTNGDVHLPATATAWHDVIQHWPGGTGDLYANWDDHVRTRDGASWLVGNAAVQFKPPVVSNASVAGFADTWLTMQPCIWNGAARPNVWFDQGSDTYPKPGSLSPADAPAWCTWSYGDSAAATSAPAYTLGARIDPQASGQSLSFAAEPGATVTYAFVGDTLSWLYAAGPAGGTATLSVEPPEGSDAPTQMWTVDQYAATMEYGERFDVGGLGAGEHTVVVESSAGLYHDAFLAPTDAADPTPLAEDHSDGATRYRWATARDWHASGGSYSYATPADSATAFTFSGTSVTWQYVAGPDRGIAQLWIDGVAKAPVDQYWAGAARHKRKTGRVAVLSTTYGGLSAGLHTILIRTTGTKRAASSGTAVTSDAFTVDGVVYED
jgi:hypothetical protein